MTENKRFSVVCCITDWYIEDKLISPFAVLTPHQASDLLNELYDENEQLKHDATVLICSNQEYRKENEQLKERNKKLYTKIFEMRTNIALEQTEINRETYTAKKNAKEFLDDLEKW